MGAVASWICAERATTQIAVIRVDGNLCFMMKKSGIIESDLKYIGNVENLPRFSRVAEGKIMSIGHSVVDWTNI